MSADATTIQSLIFTLLKTMCTMSSGGASCASWGA